MTQTPEFFPPPGDKDAREAGLALTPQFDRDGLIPAIAQCAETGEILMLAYMNAEALARTLQTGEAWYWSRSRKGFWRKGETSGHTQSVVEVRLDCDQDAVLMKVRQIGPACHTHRRSCFYRRVEKSADGALLLAFTPASDV